MHFGPRKMHVFRMLGNDNNHSSHGMSYSGSHPIICIPDDKEIIQTHGIFANENPLDFIFPLLLLQVILLFTISQIIYFILRPFRQPKFVCNILAGLILGPSGLGRKKTFLDTLFPVAEMLVFNTFAAFGAAYYAFIMAVKMDVGTLLLKSTSNINVWVISLSSYMLPFLVIQATSPFLVQRIQGNLKAMPGPALSNALASTYFPIVTHVMEELDLVTTELGRLVMACSMIAEQLSHCYSGLVGTITRGSILMAMETMVTNISPIIIAVYVVRPFILRIIRTTPEGKQVNEIYLMAIMIGALGMVFLGDVAWGIFLPGAILAGSIIPEGPPLGSILVEKYELLIMEFFLPFYFMQVGYLTDIYSIKDIESLRFTLILLMVCYCSKILATLLAASLLNIKIKNGILLGIILNFKGVFEFLLYQRWLDEKVIDTQCYSTLVLCSVCFITLSAPSIHQLYNPNARLLNFYSKTQYPRTIQTTPKDVDLRILTSIYKEDNVPNIINLLEALHPNPISPVYTYVIHSRELIGATAPSLTPFKGHSKNSIQYYSKQILRAFLKHSGDTNSLLLVEPLIMIAPYKTMHNIICNFAEDKQVPLILIPFFRNNEENLVAKNPLRGFGKKLLVNSPCTVGVLVHMRGNDGASLFSVQIPDHTSIAVIFRGGVDDREALALGIRMSGNQSTNVTVLIVTSIKYRESKCEIDLEQHLDEKLVKEFVEKNMNNNERNSYHEIEVNDAIQLMEMVQTIESRYDLVIVGKNPRIEIDESILEWMENPELGVIGDMFSTSPNCKAMNLSILVMQHYRVHEDLSKSSSHKSDVYSTWI